MPSNGYQRYTPGERRKQRNKRIIIELVVCAVLILPTLFPPANNFGKYLAQKIILSKVTLQPNSEGLKTWLNPPVDTTRNYYLFNITNPIDITTDPSNTLIDVQDTPAYSYKVKTIKNNIQWSDDDTKLSYEVERLITRDPKNFPVSSANDSGVFIDLLRAIFRTQFFTKPSDSFFDIGGFDPFSQANPIDLLEGFTSPLFDTIRAKMVGPNTAKSGFVYRQNGSRLYNISIDTNLNRKGQVSTFSSELVSFDIVSPNHYPFPIYDSATYPTMLFDKPVLNIFHADFCCPILLQYHRTVELYDGISAFEYRVKFIDINNCTDPSDTTTCQEVDKLDVSSCISSSLPSETMFLSKAHFYRSTEEVIKNMNIRGFNASREKHDSVVYFEPYTGKQLKASFRMQLNIDATIDPMKVIDGEYRWKMRKGVERLIPIFWIDQVVKLDKNKIDELKRVLTLMTYSKWFLFGLSIIVSISFIIIMELCARRLDRKKQNARKGYDTAAALLY
ncbi:hypothetical protein I4U23_006231 [Adineta vaga]|nr:hypothetical protein I4U23_006231 [Adineta vaga]